MESMICKLVAHINEQMPELSMVDEDYGQLENLEDERRDMYPITFPAVLIENTETEWSNIAGKSQKGDALFRVRLIIDCYDDTHAECGTQYAVEEREDMRSRLHTILQGFRPIDDGVLIRKRSKFFTWYHGIKVYEMTYACVVTETIRETVTIARPKVSLSVGIL
ncbi:MAG: hypothetical protein IJB60_08200 [Bacteroidaceae bacterium]|nr:hypothetical protein [Bacteroidaceae bacterium]